MNSQHKLIIETLDNALQNDAKAMNELLKHRVFLNNYKLTGDPFIICGEDLATGQDTLSVLGLLNGIMNILNMPRIVACVNDDGHIFKITDVSSLEPK